MPGNYGNVNTYFWIPILGPFVGAVRRGGGLRRADPQRAAGDDKASGD